MPANDKRPSHPHLFPTSNTIAKCAFCGATLEYILHQNHLLNRYKYHQLRRQNAFLIRRQTILDSEKDNTVPIVTQEHSQTSDTVAT